MTFVHIDDNKSDHKLESIGAIRKLKSTTTTTTTTTTVVPGLRMRLLGDQARIATVYCLVGLALILSASFVHPGDAAALNPVSGTKSRTNRGCYYMLQHYKNGETIKTDEPCLNCTCENSMLMCYLRVCPYVKPVGDRCIVERVPGECCPKITCSDASPPPEGVEQQVEPETIAPPSSSSSSENTVGSNGTIRANNFDVALTNASEVGTGAGGCTLNGNYYHEGAQLPSDPKKPCEICYCINNSSACVLQECALEVNGCAPIYQAGGCCPTRYNCTTSATGQKRVSPAANRRKFWDSFNGIATSTSRIPTTSHDVLSFSTSTTARPMALPNFGRDPERPTVTGCRAANSSRIYSDGELVPSKNKCEHCYCMRNEIVCAVQECKPPCDGCVPIYEDDKDCCPKRYECVAPTQRVPTDNILEVQPETTTPLSRTSGEQQPSSMISATVDLEITLAPISVASGGETHASSTSASSIATSSEAPDEQQQSAGSTQTDSTQAPALTSEPPTKPELSVMTTRQTNPPLRPISPKLSGEEDNLAEPMSADQESTNASKPESRESSTNVDGFSLSSGEREQETDSSKSAGRVVAPEGSMIPYANQAQDANEVIPAALTSTIAPPSTVHHASEASASAPASEAGPMSMTSAGSDSQNSDKRMRPQVIPSMIPGEGSCRYNGRLYSNGQEVKSKDNCMEICMCINSVVYCDEVDCPKGPENQDNCKRVVVEGECCPKYICEEPVETVNPPVVVELTETASTSPAPQQSAEQGVTQATSSEQTSSQPSESTSASESVTTAAPGENLSKKEEPVASELPTIVTSTEQTSRTEPATSTVSASIVSESEATRNSETTSAGRPTDTSMNTTENPSSIQTTTMNASVPAEIAKVETGEPASTVLSDTSTTLATIQESSKSATEPPSSINASQDGTSTNGVASSTISVAPNVSETSPESAPASKQGEAVTATALDQTSGTPVSEHSTESGLKPSTDESSAPTAAAPITTLSGDPKIETSSEAASTSTSAGTTTTTGSENLSPEPTTAASISPAPIEVSTSSSSLATSEPTTSATSNPEVSSTIASADPASQSMQTETTRAVEIASQQPQTTTAADPQANEVSQPSSQAPQQEAVTTSSIPESSSQPIATTETTALPSIAPEESTASPEVLKSEIPSSTVQQTADAPSRSQEVDPQANEVAQPSSQAPQQEVGSTMVIADTGSSSTPPTDQTSVASMTTLSAGPKAETSPESTSISSLSSVDTTAATSSEASASESTTVASSPVDASTSSSSLSTSEPTAPTTASSEASSSISNADPAVQTMQTETSKAAEVASQQPQTTTIADPQANEVLQASSQAPQQEVVATSSIPESSSQSTIVTETTALPSIAPEASTSSSEVRNSEIPSSTAQPATETPIRSQDANQSTSQTSNPVEPEATSLAPEPATSAPEAHSSTTPAVAETTTQSVAMPDKSPEQSSTIATPASAQPEIDQSARSENVEPIASASPNSPIGNEMMREQITSTSTSSPESTSSVQPLESSSASTVVASAEPDPERATSISTTDVAATSSPGNEPLTSSSAASAATATGSADESAQEPQTSSSAPAADASAATATSESSTQSPDKVENVDVARAEEGGQPQIASAATSEPSSTLSPIIEISSSTASIASSPLPDATTLLPSSASKDSIASSTESEKFYSFAPELSSTSSPVPSPNEVSAEVTLSPRQGNEMTTLGSIMVTDAAESSSKSPTDQTSVAPIATLSTEPRAETSPAASSPGSAETTTATGIESSSSEPTTAYPLGSTPPDASSISPATSEPTTPTAASSELSSTIASADPASQATQTETTIPAEVSSQQPQTTTTAGQQANEISQPSSQAPQQEEVATTTPIPSLTAGGSLVKMGEAPMESKSMISTEQPSTIPPEQTSSSPDQSPGSVSQTEVVSPQTSAMPEQYTDVAATSQAPTTEQTNSQSSGSTLPLEYTNPTTPQVSTETPIKKEDTSSESVATSEAATTATSLESGVSTSASSAAPEAADKSAQESQTSSSAPEADASPTVAPSESLTQGLNKVETIDVSRTDGGEQAQTSSAATPEQSSTLSPVTESSSSTANIASSPSSDPATSSTSQDSIASSTESQDNVSSLAPELSSTSSPPQSMNEVSAEVTLSPRQGDEMTTSGSVIVTDGADSSSKSTSDQTSVAPTTILSTEPKTNENLETASSPSSADITTMASNESSSSAPSTVSSASTDASTLATGESTTPAASSPEVSSTMAIADPASQNMQTETTKEAKAASQEPQGIVSTMVTDVASSTSAPDQTLVVSMTTPSAELKAEKSPESTSTSSSIDKATETSSEASASESTTTASISSAPVDVSSISPAITTNELTTPAAASHTDQASMTTLPAEPRAETSPVISTSSPSDATTTSNNESSSPEPSTVGSTPVDAPTSGSPLATSEPTIPTTASPETSSSISNADLAVQTMPTETSKAAEVASQQPQTTTTTDPQVNEVSQASSQAPQQEVVATSSVPESSSQSSAVTEATVPPQISSEAPTTLPEMKKSEIPSSTPEAPIRSQEVGQSTSASKPVEPDVTSLTPELTTSTPETHSSTTPAVAETTTQSVAMPDKSPEQSSTIATPASAQPEIDQSARSENVEPIASASPNSPIGNEVMREQITSTSTSSPESTSTVQPPELSTASIEVASAEPNFERSTTMSPAEVKATSSPGDEFLASISTINGTNFKPVEITTVIPSIRGQSTPITIPWSHIANNSQPEAPAATTTTESAPVERPASISFGNSTVATKSISHEPTQSSVGVSESDYEEISEEPGCEYEGKTYNSAQQIPRSHPCDFCFCFRGDIICLQQTCPPPVPHCFESVMDGFCCPRYECPVHTVRSSPNSTSLSLTPFESHSQLQTGGSASLQQESPAAGGSRNASASARLSSIKGCFVDNKLYGVGQEIVSASSPCLECKCDKSGMMKCNPKECTPEDQLLQQINRDVLQSTLSRSQAR